MKDIVQKVTSGDVRSVARAITVAERGGSDAADLMRSIFPKTGQAMVIGITGAPGAGKSSLVDKLALHYKDAGEKVGIVCTSSPIPGTSTTTQTSAALAISISSWPTPTVSTMIFG